MPSTSKSKKIYSPASSSYGFTLSASITENSTNNGANTSNITVTAKIKADSTIAFSTNSNNNLAIYLYDNNNNSGGTKIAEKTVKSLAKSGSASATGTVDVGHLSDGTLNAYAKAVWTKSGSVQYVPSSNNVSTDTIAMTTIPRQTSITGFSVSKRNETSFTFNWSTADTIDYVWYSTNNGGSWTGYDVSDGTSGSFTVSGLSPNTTYNCKLRVRRRDSQMTTDSGTVSQTTYKAPTQTMSSKTETTISMNWSADGTVNYVWYSIDNGTNWTAVGAVNATSGSYTITGLTANTTYNVRTRVRRSSSSTTYDVASTSIQTYQYPYVSAVSIPALTIGDSQTLTLYNPLGRTCTVYMKQTDTSGTTLYTGTTSTTSISFTPTANDLYASIPNATSGNAVYYCIYSEQNVGTKTGTYVIDNSQGQQNPEFEVTDWSYTANYTNLTNNDQVVIANASTVTFSIDNAATPKNSATIVGYRLIWGIKNTTIESGTGTVAESEGNTLQVTAIDSRGYSTTTSLNLEDNYVSYFFPTISNATALRDDGIKVDTFLDINGSFFNQLFGADGENNELTSAKYYTSTDNENWSNAFDIPISSFTLSNDNYRLQDFAIHLNGVSGGFPVGTQYYVKVQVSDYFKTVLFENIIISKGIIAKDVYVDNDNEYHVGINGLADNDYTLNVHGSINATNTIYINGVDLETYINNIINS